MAAKVLSDALVASLPTRVAMVRVRLSVLRVSLEDGVRLSGLSVGTGVKKLYLLYIIVNIGRYERAVLGSCEEERKAWPGV